MVYVRTVEFTCCYSCELVALTVSPKLMFVLHRGVGEVPHTWGFQSKSYRFGKVHEGCNQN